MLVAGTARGLRGGVFWAEAVRILLKSVALPRLLLIGTLLLLLLLFLLELFMILLFLWLSLRKSVLVTPLSDVERVVAAAESIPRG